MATFSFTDNECYIPVYMLNVHAHRVGPDSEIYKEHCERWKFRKEIAEVQAVAGREGFIAAFHQNNVLKLVDGNIDWYADQHATKVRGGE